MSTTINVSEELAEAKVGTLHRWLGVMMAALTLFDGYDTFNPAYVIHYVVGPWALGPKQAGFLVSSGLIGFLIGAVTHGVIADRIGRRVTLLGGLWITSLFTLATALFANSFASFCTLRLLTGIGLGVLLPLATTYINELAPRKSVNTFALWGVGIGWALGGTMAGVVGVLLTPTYGWEVLYWIGSLSIVLAIALQFFLPESIKFLSMKGREEEIRTLLTRLRPERSDLYRGAQFVLNPVQVQRNPVSALLTSGLRRTTLTIWFAAFLSLFCIFGLTGWIPTVMMKRGETFAASFGFGALIQIMSFFGGLACGYVADRRGSSRGPLALWWLVGGLCMLSLVYIDSHVGNFVVVAGAGFFMVGVQFVLNNFTANAYGTEMRATGVGMMLSVGRLGAILGPFVVGVLQVVHPGPDAMFVLLGCASIVAALAVFSLGSRPSPNHPQVTGQHAHG